MKFHIIITHVVDGWRSGMERVGWENIHVGHGVA